MVNWFIEESSNQFLPRVVCSRAITLLDRYLMRGVKIQIDTLQEIGIACLGLAWKFNELGVDIIPVDEHKFSKSNILHFERDVLQELDYRIEGPTYVSITLDLLHTWDEFSKKKGKEHGLPIYLEKMRDDECNDMAALLRVDELLSIVDLCSSGTSSLTPVLDFLDFTPQDIAFNILFFFVAKYRHWEETVPNLVNVFHQFSEAAAG